jgi:hypothetical protein
MTNKSSKMTGKRKGTEEQEVPKTKHIPTIICNAYDDAAKKKKLEKEIDKIYSRSCIEVFENGKVKDVLQVVGCHEHGYKVAFSDENNSSKYCCGFAITQHAWQLLQKNAEWIDELHRMAERGTEYVWAKNSLVLDRRQDEDGTTYVGRIKLVKWDGKKKEKVAFVTDCTCPHDKRERTSFAVLHPESWCYMKANIQAIDHLYENAERLNVLVDEVLALEDKPSDYSE